MSANSLQSPGPVPAAAGRLLPCSLALAVVCGLTIMLSARTAISQPQPAEFLEHAEELKETASEALQSVKDFFKDSRVQTVVVLILIILGLTLWLLGARAGRVLFALLLATSAIVPGMYLAEVLKLSLWPGALVGGLLGMLIGVFIFRIGIMLVTMCLSTLLAVSIFAVVRFEPADWAELKTAVQDYLVDDSQQNSRSSTAEGSQKLQDVVWNLGGKYQRQLLVTTVAGLAAGLLLQLFARSFMLVLTTSCLGTAMILGGVCLGLAFKGHKPDELLGLKPTSTVLIFLVMLGLGMLVQLTMTRKRHHPEPEEDEE